MDLPVPSQVVTDVPEEATSQEATSQDLRPSRSVFVLAFLSVLVAGLLGTAIGAGLTDVMCRGSCAVNVAVGAVVGAVIGAGGVAVVAVLVLRAMVEWNTQRARELADQAAGLHSGAPPPDDQDAHDREPPRC